MKTVTDANGKTWTVDDVDLLLVRSDAAVFRAVVVLYERQTEDERATDQTTHRNGVGFNGVDARLMSYYARWIKQNGCLTGRHVERARRAVRKYRAQLLDAIAARAGRKAA